MQIAKSISTIGVNNGLVLSSLTVYFTESSGSCSGNFLQQRNSFYLQSILFAGELEGFDVINRQPLQ